MCFDVAQSVSDSGGTSYLIASVAPKRSRRRSSPRLAARFQEPARNPVSGRGPTASASGSRLDFVSHRRRRDQLAGRPRPRRSPGRVLRLGTGKAHLAGRRARSPARVLVVGRGCGSRTGWRPGPRRGSKPSTRLMLDRQRRRVVRLWPGVVGRRSIRCALVRTSNQRAGLHLAQERRMYWHRQPRFHQ